MPRRCCAASSATGVDEIIARIGGAILRLDHTQHLVGNHQVTVDGDTGTHRCHLQSQHVLEGCEGGDNFIVGGYYEDRVVRTADGWRIAHRPDAADVDRGQSRT